MRRVLLLSMLLFCACDKAPPPAPAAPPTPLEPDANRRIVLEQEKHCRGLRPDKGEACLVSATAFEIGEPGIEKDVHRAWELYDVACKANAATRGHDPKFYCNAANRLAAQFPDAGP